MHPLPSMDPTADEELSVNDIWPILHQGRRQHVCHLLAQYRGPVASTFFETLVRGARATQLFREARAQLAAKRKLFDDEEADHPSAPKKVKVSEAPALLQTEDIELASPIFPLRWPTFRQAPIKFGQPTLTASTSNTTSTTWSSPHATAASSSDDVLEANTDSIAIPTRQLSSPRSLASSRGTSHRGVLNPRGGGSSTSTGSNLRSFTSSATVSNQGGASSFSSTVPKPGVFSSLFGRAKANTPASQVPECDEQFTFADHQSSQAPVAQQQIPPAQYSQYRSSDQPSPASSNDSSPNLTGSQFISAVYKPPFAGVDMSSLKIPADPNVSLTLNALQDSSSLHQTTDSDATRKLKCIYCSVFYIEVQNTALECRRHTGTDPRWNFAQFAKNCSDGKGDRLFTFLNRSLCGCQRPEA